MSAGGVLNLPEWVLNQQGRFPDGFNLAFTSNIGVGSGVGGSGGFVSSFLLQPGIYQAQFSAHVFNCLGALLALELDGTPVASMFPSTVGPACTTPNDPSNFGIIAESVILQVSSPNQTLTVTVQGGGLTGSSLIFAHAGDAILILTQLQ
jgi:hypothetical protein